MRRITNLMMCLLLGIACWAIPADKTPMKVTQSDGSTLTLRLVGDEFFHYNTTDDGYTVLRNAGGSYEYAVKQGGVLMASGLLAHDAAQRTPAERQLLSQVGTHLRADGAVQRARQSREFAQNPAFREPTVDYSNFRGLIILINYTDRQFGMDDPHDFYDKMANQENYSGFNFNGRFQRCTGSMYDYFSDQSGGIFKPQFDVVGPVNVDYASTDHGGTENSWRIFWAALDAADEIVDFSNYDNDGDGAVDMVYFLVAGYSANYSGNNGDYLWPHKAYLYDYEHWEAISYDGTYLSAYASSTEIYGWESQGYPIPLGIGTMAHEFSHVLGLPDLYDTDYGENGQSHDPGEWDVMAGGDYNMGRTPCAYTAWERYALGWIQPQEINSTGSYSLQYVGTTGQGLILRTPVDGEYFMLDNRQNVKWDAALPGHGLMIARVDSTNTWIWDANKVNCFPSHNYYELLRAGNSTSGTHNSDPFPGTDNVTDVDNYTEPSLCTWAGELNQFGITGIREENGVVYFEVITQKTADSIVEDFETMPLCDEKTAENVTGRFAKWRFLNAHVILAGDYGNGEKAVGMYNNSLIAMQSPVEVNAFKLSFHVNNPNSTSAKFSVYYSSDGEQWEKLNPDMFIVGSKSQEKFSERLNLSGPTYFRINLVSAAKNSPTYVDDITFEYLDSFSRPGDVTGDGMVDISDVNALINMMLGKISPTPVADINGDGNVDISDVNAVINLMLGKK